MSTLADLRYLTGVLISWLETPSVEDFDTSEVLNGANEFVVLFFDEQDRWAWRFGTSEFMPCSKTAEYHFDLTEFGIISHADAMEFLQTEAWDFQLQLIARKYDGILLN